MNRTELWDLIRNGRDSGAEFTRHGIENHELAKAQRRRKLCATAGFVWPMRARH